MVESENRYLLSKIDSLDNRLETHVSKIELRLDQLVHLMQAVAQLQEKQNNNSEAIADNKRALKEALEKFEKTIERIHVRLDKIDDDSEKDINAMFEKTRNVSDKVTAVDEKVSRWMNRGIGIWIGVSALVVVLQTIGGVVLSSFKDEYLTAKAQISEISKRQSELESDISRTNAIIRNNHPAK